MCSVTRRLLSSLDGRRAMGILGIRETRRVCFLLILSTAVTAGGMSAAADGAAHSFITDSYPPTAVNLASSQRAAAISTLQAEAKHANPKDLQAISFVLAEWGIDYERNKNVLARSLQLCGARNPSCDEDTAGYLIGLYSTGHADVLPVLVSVGPKTDAAVAERLGAFYQEVLTQTPDRFFSVVRSLANNQRSEVCEMAGTGDGGGIADDALNRAKSYAFSARGESARSCFERIAAANKSAQSQNRP